jgi:hypothetical protein
LLIIRREGEIFRRTELADEANRTRVSERDSVFREERDDDTSALREGRYVVK